MVPKWQKTAASASLRPHDPQQVHQREVGQMEKIKQWDEFILKRTQDSYLWLFDRTGVYAGTVAVTAFLAGEMFDNLDDKAFTGLTMFNIGLNGANCIFRCVLQNSEKYEIYNAIARSWSSSVMRIVICVSFLAIAIVETASGQYFSAISCMLNILFFNYALSWQIRKREPPEKIVFAPQSQSL